MLLRCRICAVVIHLGTNGKEAKPRQLHNTHWEWCALPRSEGQAVGLVKNLALMAHITTGTASARHGVLEEFSTENLTDICRRLLPSRTPVRSL
jgi:DNA-directed RNA polymerase II subunit RPB2